MRRHTLLRRSPFLVFALVTGALPLAGCGSPTDPTSACTTIRAAGETLDQPRTGKLPFISAPGRTICEEVGSLGGREP
jgi:hypothetical protein